MKHIMPMDEMAATLLQRDGVDVFNLGISLWRVNGELCTSDNMIDYANQLLHPFNVTLFIKPKSGLKVVK